MNSTPAASNARRRAWLFAAVIDVWLSANSARRIVVTPTAEWRAKSSALQRTRARPALSCALVRGFDILTDSFRMIYFIPYGIIHAAVHYTPWNTEDVMKQHTRAPCRSDRRYFIGGSDARIIM